MTEILFAFFSSRNKMKICYALSNVNSIFLGFISE